MPVIRATLAAAAAAMGAPALPLAVVPLGEASVITSSSSLLNNAASCHITYHIERRHRTATEQFTNLPAEGTTATYLEREPLTERTT